MKRTLYLNENERNIRISLDGPSLLIASPFMSERRIPIRLISRVIIFGNIPIESDILTYLAEEGIPILFISKWAKKESISLPLNYGMPSHCINHMLIMKDESKTEEFINWARQMRAFLQGKVIKSLYPSHHMIDNNNYRKIISFCMPEDKEKWFTVKTLIKTLFFGHILAEIINSHLNPHCGIIHKKCSFGLLKDFLYILHPETDVQALQFFKSDSIDNLIEGGYKNPFLTSKGIHNIVHRFENRQYIMKGVVEKTLDKLFELLKEQK